MLLIAEEYLKEEENIYIIYINKDNIKISNELKHCRVSSKKNSIKNELM